MDHISEKLLSNSKIELDGKIDHKVDSFFGFDWWCLVSPQVTHNKSARERCPQGVISRIYKSCPIFDLRSLHFIDIWSCILSRGVGSKLRLLPLGADARRRCLNAVAAAAGAVQAGGGSDLKKYVFWYLRMLSHIAGSFWAAAQAALVAAGAGAEPRANPGQAEEANQSFDSCEYYSRI